MSWWLTSGPPPWIRLRREVDRLLDRPGCRTDRASADHQPLLDEPVTDQVVALADLAEDLLGPDLDVLVDELRVLVDEGVRVPRGALDRQPGRVRVDDEERRLVVDPGQREDEVGHVTDGDEPLLAVDDVRVADPLGRGRHRQRVGAGELLGHRDGVALLTADARQQVALPLLRRAGLERVGRTPHGVPQRVGQPSQASRGRGSAPSW